MTSNTDDLEMQSIRAEVGDSGATPIERHSQHPSSSTTLNDVISLEHPRTQPLHGQPRIAVTIPNANTRSDEHPEHHAPTSVSTIGPQITSRSENNAGHKKFENAEGANPCSGRNEPIVPEIQTVQVVGQPTGWAAMAEDIRKYDEDKVKECRDDIDTLMTFAGLFSAAITAFLVESYQALLPNRADETLQVLRFIAQQNLIANGRNSSLDLALLPSVAASGMASSNGLVLVNILWFASLILSLVAASFSMLVKHWLREYLAVNNPSAQARLRVRRCREPSLTVWKVFEIAAALPFLLQLALALFFAGLCIFTTSVHTTVGSTTTALVCAWAFCFLAVTLLPIFFPRCPYKTTFLSRLMRWAHIHLPEGLKSNNYQDEKILTKDPSYDLEILADVDALQGDDELLGTTILESIGQFHRPQLPNLIDFLRKILNHRCQIVRAGDAPWPVNSDLQSLTDRGKKAIRDIIAKYAHAEDTSTIVTPKTEDGTSPLDQICAFLLSPNLQPLSDACVHLLRMRLDRRLRVTKVFTALLQQLDSRSVNRAEWCQIALKISRYIEEILDLSFDKAFKQFLSVMEAFHSYTHPHSPQKGSLYSWVEAFSPDGITYIGAFLCESVTAEMHRPNIRSINHTGDCLNSLRQATHCVLYLKQFRGTLKPADPTAMQAEISSLLAATFATENNTLSGAILTECIQQKDTLYEQVLRTLLTDTRQSLIESGQIIAALSTFGSLIHGTFLPQDGKTLNRYLKLCFIAICLVPPSGPDAILKNAYDELFTSFSIILSRCLAAVDESSRQSDVTLQRLCLTQLNTTNVVHEKLFATLKTIDDTLRPVSSGAVVPAKANLQPSSSPSSGFKFTGALDRSRTTNTFHHAVRQARQFVDVPRRRDSVSAAPIAAPPITPSVANNIPLPHLARG